MSVFTTVTPQQLGTWLKNYSIGTLIALEGITAGIENTNYFVTTTQGRFVLTLFEKLTSRELPFYLNLMAHLASHGVPCPRPIADMSGALLGELNAKPAALVSFLPGKDLTRAAPAHCRQVGTMLANIHLAGQSYGQSEMNPRGPRWWNAVMPEIIPFLDTDDTALLGSVLGLARRIAKEQGIADRGFRTVINTGEDGGQSVSHLHVHILGGRHLDWPPG